MVLGHGSGQLVQAAFVFDQQDAVAGQWGGQQLAGAHAHLRKGQQAGRQRGDEQPVVVFGQCA